MGRGTFGLVSSRARGRGFRGGSTHYRGGRGRGRGGSSSSAPKDTPAPLRDEDGTALEERFESVRVNDEVDEKLGFARVQEGKPREGWLINMHPVSLRTMFGTQHAKMETSCCRHY
jgi:DNA polymerase epsilon subunit 1